MLKEMVAIEYISIASPKNFCAAPHNADEFGDAWVRFHSL